MAENRGRCRLRVIGRWRGVLRLRCKRPSHIHDRHLDDWWVDTDLLYREMTRRES